MEKGKAIFFLLATVFFLNASFLWGLPQFPGEKLDKVEELFKPVIPEYNLVRKIEGFLLLPEIILILEEIIISSKE